MNLKDHKAEISRIVSRLLPVRHTAGCALLTAAALSVLLCACSQGKKEPEDSRTAERTALAFAAVTNEHRLKSASGPDVDNAISESVSGPDEGLTESVTVPETEEPLFSEIFPESEGKTAEALLQADFSYTPFEEKALADILAKYTSDETAGSVLWVSPDGLNFSYLREEGVYDYRGLFAIQSLRVFMKEEEGFLLGTGDDTRNSMLALMGDTDREDSPQYREAEDRAAALFADIGFRTAYMSSCMMSKESLERMRKAREEYFGAAQGSFSGEEEGVVIFFARQYAGDILVENYMDEACIFLVYSVSRKEFLLIRSYIPPIGEELPPEEDTLPETQITAQEAIEAARAVLEARQYTREAEAIDGAYPVYFVEHNTPVYHTSTHKVTLKPGWKITFPVTVKGKTCEDYVIIDAVSGTHKSNAVPLE